MALGEIFARKILRLFWRMALGEFWPNFNWELKSLSFRWNWMANFSPNAVRRQLFAGQKSLVKSTPERQGGRQGRFYNEIFFYIFLIDHRCLIINDIDVFGSSLQSCLEICFDYFVLYLLWMKVWNHFFLNL